jgi:hypothetical protein
MATGIEYAPGQHATEQVTAHVPGRVFVVACEPEVVEDVGLRLSEAVSGSLACAADVVLETIAELE